MSEATLSDEQVEFQQYARNWLAENAPPPPPVRLPLQAIEVMTTAQRDYLQAWQTSCYEAGLVGCDVPEAYGGGGHEAAGTCQVENERSEAVLGELIEKINADG